MVMIHANFAPLRKRFDQSFSGEKYSHFKVMPWTVWEFPRISSIDASRPCGSNAGKCIEFGQLIVEI
eukprot:scaffold136770_cov31-Attheya_sp.AAC.2